METFALLPLERGKKSLSDDKEIKRFKPSEESSA